MSDKLNAKEEQLTFGFAKDPEHYGYSANLKGAVIVGFVDAKTSAIRKEAIQRIAQSGVFRLSSSNALKTGD